VALPYLGVLIGYTHHWNEEWRSTGSYGYVEMENEESQGPDAYHATHYASLNVMWQIRERLTLGLEGLYGHKETQDGSTGDVGRAQFGVLYSIF
jgi:outer membrane receptor for ferrienterochelin and colicin